MRATHLFSVSVLVLVPVALVLAACDRPRFHVGEGCDVNSDCSAPLVCALGVCRIQCAESRDCGAGLRCLVEDPALGGGCQIDDEAQCELTSECQARDPALVCHNRTCTTECREDRDCAEGATCMEIEGVAACYEAIAENCEYNTDCPAPMVCGLDQRCRLECVEDRDCTVPRTCVANLCELPDGGM